MPLHQSASRYKKAAEKRLWLTSNGNIRYPLKTPYRNGTTQVIFEPLDFMARLAALVPRPRAKLTRLHGVFAPNNSKHRALVTPWKRGKRRQTPDKRRSAIAYGAACRDDLRQRLKRVFNIDITICEECGGSVKVVASIEDPVVIKQILAHLERKAESKEFSLLPEDRESPQPGFFG